MFEKLMQIAEQAATGMSRREFFGRLGRGATAVAIFAAGASAAFAGGGAATTCNDYSSFQCRGKAVGSPCWVNRGQRGHCRTGPACLCYAN